MIESAGKYHTYKGELFILIRCDRDLVSCFPAEGSPIDHGHLFLP